MNRLERFESLNDLLLTALDGWQTQIWTAMPAIVASYNAVEMTIEALPAIMGQVTSREGVVSQVIMPLLVDVPVQFPGGGGFTMTFPLVPGDEVLVIFTARCFDAWWQSSGVQPQVELRMHDLSDGFAIPRVRSKPNALVPQATQNTAQLRSDDGTTYIELAAGQMVNIVAPGGLNIVGPVNILGSVGVQGPVQIDGSASVLGETTLVGETEVTGVLTNNDVNIGSTHMHILVQTGTGISGPPEPI